MAISFSFENKTTALGLSLEGKPSAMTWDEANFSWDEATGTWETPASPTIEESKNNISLSLETKL